MNGQLISVIIPVYNVEQYVEKCVDSVINQTYEKLEIILVDDGSTDKSGQLCDVLATKDERIVVVHQKNGGLSAARNTGIEKATGEVLSFVDSDDVLDLNFLKTLLEAMEKENADIVQCGFSRFADESELIALKEKELESAIDVIDSREGNLRLYSERGNEYTVVWNKIYKKRLFEELRFPVGRINEDAFTTYKLFYKATKIAVIEPKLYLYRYRADSIMTQKIRHRNLDMIVAYDERMEFYQSINDVELYHLCKKKSMYSLVVLYRKATFGSDDKQLLQDIYNRAVKVFNESNVEDKIFKSTEKIKYRFFVKIPRMYSYISQGMLYVKRVCDKVKRLVSA